ncbi:MAG: 50S ribosomal protein L29 [Deltaproteobacteria bacterium]|nr:50S ribosomal protein L29 [Deltaproteobacteria bacterium]MBW2395871.1 50S ribosomal protein L29 [Deltaproteobacteria bacterium]
MKAAELRDLSSEELLAKSEEMRTELVNVRLHKATGQLEDTAKLRTLRRNVARVETILREKRGADQ